MTTGAVIPLAPVGIATLTKGRVGTRVMAGESGTLVLRFDGEDPLYLKLGQGRVADDVAEEAARLAWLAGRIACPPIRHSEVGDDGAWLLTGALPGEPAGAWLTRDMAYLPRVASALAGFLRSLHALPADECPFDSSVTAWLPAARQRVAGGLVDEDDFDDDHLGLSATEVLATVERLAPHVKDRVVVHGDFTLGNVLLDEAGCITGCIDVGRLGVADPYQDIALMWRDLGGFEEAAQAAFLNELGIDKPDQPRLLLHRALDELF